MKKNILLIVVFLFLTGLTNAQVLADFDSDLGIMRDEGWGPITDSIYQSADPLGASPGVMAVHFNLQAVAGNNAIGLLEGQKCQISAKYAQSIDNLIFLNEFSEIPDSLA